MKHLNDNLVKQNGHNFSMNKSKSNIVIQLNNISKTYVIHHEKPTTTDALLRRNGEKFIALNNINLTIGRGERIGIIGANGSGKTTLLKIIAGVTTPTSGTVQARGKVISLIDLEAGFHPELTGLENIYLNAMLLGLSKKEISSIVPKVIKFAEIEHFIDAPLFTYSSGMKLRLGFSIAINSNPDILILDEIMLIGDSAFQKKSIQKIREFFKKEKTIIIASHMPSFILDNCNRCILLEKGIIKNTGNPKKIINGYEKSVIASMSSSKRQ